MQRELVPVAPKWRSIGAALQLKFDVLQSIDTRYSGDPCECLLRIMIEWLMRNYNVKEFGEPTWQRLVEAVGDPEGGANMALAKYIARTHKPGGISGIWYSVTVDTSLVYNVLSTYEKPMCALLPTSSKYKKSGTVYASLVPRPFGGRGLGTVY